MELNFTKDYVLENERVRLSPLTLSHLASLAPIADDPFIWIYFLEKGQGLEQLTAYVQSALANRKKGKEYPFIVFDKVQQQYAGTTRFYEYSPQLATIKLGHTWYGKAFRGTGLNKHCKYLLFQFAFEQLKVARIGFGAYRENARSVAAMKSVGCRPEGVLRDMFPSIDGKGRSDAVLYSILRGEWEEVVKANLASLLR